jgi:outer membrane protein assembly factor BamD (BamD/ComL family)
MSVSGISSSSLSDYNTQSVQNKMQQFQQEFQQLGQDLQSGNLSAAQSDFATLQQYAPQSSSTSSSQSNNPIAQAFSQLAQDLQSGNTSAAQQDYSTIQQDFQSHATDGHHHHHGGGGSGANAISQLMSQLGQALQSGNLTSAQQAYSTLQQEFQQSTQNNGVATTSSTQSGSNNVSVSI